MKIALFTSGHVRTLFYKFHENISLIKERVPGCEVDVFYSFWDDYSRSNKINDEQELKITSWKKRYHVYAIIIVTLLAIISGFLLEKYTQAALPFLDAFTTWGAIIATYMVAKKIIENWIYWFVIDSISIYLFISRELYLTSLLFFIYLIIIIFGYRSWRKKLNADKTIY